MDTKQSSIHYRLKDGDVVNVEAAFDEWDLPTFDKRVLKFQNLGCIFDFFVVARVRKKHRCSVCGEILNKGRKYFGFHSIHHNWPKFCRKCAIQTFSDHKLEQFRFSYVLDSNCNCWTHTKEIVLREIDIEILLT